MERLGQPMPSTIEFLEEGICLAREAAVHVHKGAPQQRHGEARIDRGRALCGQFFDRCEAQLDGSAYLAGDNFTIADITLMSVVWFSGWVEVDATDGRPALGNWYRQVSARPSARA